MTKKIADPTDGLAAKVARGVNPRASTIARLSAWANIESPRPMEFVAAIIAAPAGRRTLLAFVATERRAAVPASEFPGRAAAVLSEVAPLFVEAALAAGDSVRSDLAAHGLELANKDHALAVATFGHHVLLGQFCGGPLLRWAYRCTGGRHVEAVGLVGLGVEAVRPRLSGSAFLWGLRQSLKLEPIRPDGGETLFGDGQARGAALAQVLAAAGAGEGTLEAGDLWARIGRGPEDRRNISQLEARYGVALGREIDQHRADLAGRGHRGRDDGGRSAADLVLEPQDAPSLDLRPDQQAEARELEAALRATLDDKESAGLDAWLRGETHVEAGLRLGRDRETVARWSERARRKLQQFKEKHGRS